jgi:serine beta-lactamase-like protein LACTB
MMRFCLLVTCLTLLAGCQSSAEKFLTETYQQAVSSVSVPGISVAVANRQGIIWAAGFGYADIENQVAMTSEHKMRIGSIAKPFTTAAMMRMAEQGKIDIDTPVANYVAAWPAKHAPLTLRQIAAHTSGIRHYKDDEFFSNVAYGSVTESLAIFADDPLLFLPGTDKQYSTYAWTLLSAALEGADGQRDFKQIMYDEVFTPLAMLDTRFDDQYPIISKRQRPYTWQDDQLQNSMQTDHSYKWAGGGFLATASDVSRFAIAHLDEGYLKQATLTEMFSPATTLDGTTLENGIGWVVGFGGYQERYTDQPEILAIMDRHKDSVLHSGGSMGGTTMMILSRSHGLAVTVVKNVDGDDSVDVVKLALMTLDSFHQGINQTP